MFLMLGNADLYFLYQGKAKKTRKFATVKRMLNPNDMRLFVFDPISSISMFAELITSVRRIKSSKLKRRLRRKKRLSGACKQSLYHCNFQGPL